MNYLKALIFIFVAPILLSSAAIAQSTGFTYQGSLENGGIPATGNFDFEFVLYDSLAGGAQLGQTSAMNNVVVTNGTFAVRLDFGNQFSGANRFLEIRVRPAGQPGITVLNPRQLINSAPYSVKSLTSDNATNATNATTAITATNFTGSLAGNVSGTQGETVINTVGGQTAASVANATQAVNSATDANVPNTLVMRNANGDFSANTLIATQQYNIGPNRVLGINGTNNIFVGVNAGLSNTTGNDNSFFGAGAGEFNTTGGSNSFFGRNAGFSNTSGDANSFFGGNAGQSNTTGGDNSFFGFNAGESNTTGDSNSFFGRSSGLSNTTGFSNSFFGRNAGIYNTTGFNNSFFGHNAGVDNTTGSSNSFFGRYAGLNNTTGFSNSFFGTSAGDSSTTGHNNSFFGALAGHSNTTGDSNTFFGSSTGQANTTGNANSIFGPFAGFNNTSGLNNSFFGYNAGESNTTGDSNTIIGSNADVGSGNLTFATAIGADSVVSTSNTVVLGRSDDIVRIPGFLRVVQLGSPGSTPLCQNVNDTISTCSSSIRYKSNINVFRSGLDLIKRLRPVSFNWKEGGMRDMGLVAEEVAEVDPLLVTTNKKGEVEGVKYDRLGVVLINAVNEQQATIEAQQKQIDEQSQIITAQKEKLEIAEKELSLQKSEHTALKNLVCSQNPTAEICKPKEQ